MSLEEVRQAVAHKAFQALAHNFFRNTDTKSRFPSWARDIVVPEVLEKVLWFFHRGTHRSIENFYEFPGGKDIHARTARKFILDLCRFAWKFEYFDASEEEQDREIQGRLRQVWPRLIEMLSRFKELSRLLDDNYEVDAPCLAKLEELALSKTLVLPSLSGLDFDRRRPKTLEEACLGGSSAAEVLLTLRIKESERDRIDGIRDREVASCKAETAP